MATLDDLKPIFESIQDSSNEQASLLKSFIQGQEREAKQGAAGRSTRAAGGRESTTIRGGISRGVESGIGGILGGIGGGLGILAKFAGAAAGLGAAGVGIAAFLTAIGGADAAIEKLGDGSNIKTLLGNLGEGIAQLDGKALKVLGVIAGTGALVGAASVTVAGKAAVGMGAVGLGIGGFMAGIAAAGDLTGFTGAKFAEQAGNIATGIKALSGLDDRSLAGITAIAGTGALIGGVSVTVAGKAAVGMGAAGLGIGGFMAGIAAAGDLTGFDGKFFAAQATNVATGLKALEGLNDKTKVALVALAGAGAVAGAIPGGAITAAWASVGMGAAGFGLGAFVSGIAAAGDLADFVGVDGSGLKNTMENLAVGMKSFEGIDGTNLANIGTGMAGLGEGMLALFAENALGGIKEAPLKIWNSILGWFGYETGQTKGKFDDLVEQLQVFNKKDFSGISALSEAKVGENLEALANALKKFPEVTIADAEALSQFISSFDDVYDIAEQYGDPEFEKIGKFSSQLDLLHGSLSKFVGFEQINFKDILNIGGAAEAFGEMSTVLNMLENGGTETIRVPVQEGSRAYGRKKFQDKTITTENIDQMMARSEKVSDKLREIRSLFGISDETASGVNTQKLRDLADSQLITSLKMSQLVEIQADTFELLERTFPAGVSQVIIAPNNSVNTNAPQSSVESTNIVTGSNNELDATATPGGVQ